MSKKPAILRYLNARAIRRGFLLALNGVLPLREYLDYYDEWECFADTAISGSLRTLTIDPRAEYGLRFDKRVRKEVLRCSDEEIENLRLTYEMGRFRNVTVLGSSGLTINNDTGKALGFRDAGEKLGQNWVTATPLKFVPADDSCTCINLLWIRKGHRHFAHFFWDMMVPLMVYLEQWRDPDEQICVLVREDLTAIQRDTFEFLARDYPNLAFRTLPYGNKISCKNLIYLAFNHRNRSLDNTLARKYLALLADLYRRNYQLDRATEVSARRIYISRDDAVRRRVVNEKEVIAMLARHGFESCVTGRMPFGEQARLFAGAEAIVAPHGAGLANMMFCKPGTKVLEFFPSNYIDAGLCRLAHGIGLRYRFLIAEKGAMPKLAFRVDVDALEQEVLAMLD